LPDPHSGRLAGCWWRRVREGTCLHRESHGGASDDVSGTGVARCASAAPVTLLGVWRGYRPALPATDAMTARGPREVRTGRHGKDRYGSHSRWSSGRVISHWADGLGWRTLPPNNRPTVEGEPAFCGMVIGGGEQGLPDARHSAEDVAKRVLEHEAACGDGHGVVPPYGQPWRSPKVR